MTCSVVHDAPKFDGRDPGEVLAWAAERFAGRLTVASSLGVEDCVLIHVAHERALKLDYFTLDTGVLFPETLELWKKLEQRYGITLRAVRPEQSIEQQAAAHGPKLWEREPNLCCNLRKVQPLKR